MADLRTPESCRESSDPGSEIPSWSKSILVGSQHAILVIFGVVLVPVMITKMHGLAISEADHVIFATLVSAGIATLLQVIRRGQFGLGQVLFMGTAGAYLACAHAAVEMGGFGLLTVMSILTAPIFAIYGFFLRYLRRIITPTVGGVVIMLAVSGLLKDATITWTGDMNFAWDEAGPRIIVGTVTIFSMMGTSWLGGASMRPWSLLIGIGVGVATASMMGIMDVAHLREVPLFGHPGEYPHLAFDQFDLAHFFLWATFVMAAVVTCVSYTGNAMAIQEIVGHDKGKEDYEAIQGGLYSSSISTLVAGLLGGMPLAPNSPNLPLLKMTRATSRRIGVAGAMIIIISAFFPKLHAAVLCVPGPVLGATAIYLVAQLFATGMAMVASEGLNFHNGQIAGLSLVMGIVVESDLFFPHAFPKFLEPIYTNGFAVAGLSAIALSTLHNVILERWDVFTVHPHLDDLSKIHSKIDALSKKYGLNRRSATNLGLACEEAFVHIIDTADSDNHDQPLKFCLKPASEAIDVEISLGARAKEVSDPKTFTPHQADEEELRKLGLFLLCKVANDIGHIFISGHTFMSFRVMVK